MLSGQTTQQSQDEGQCWSGEELLPDICIQAAERPQHKSSVPKGFCVYSCKDTSRRSCIMLGYGHLLFGIWDMFLHVVQSALRDSFLENEIFQLMAVAVVLDPGGDFAETVQKHFVVGAVLLIVPVETKAEGQFSIEFRRLGCFWPSCAQRRVTLTCRSCSRV